MSLKMTKWVCALAVMSVFASPQARAETDAELQEAMVKMTERQGQDVASNAPDCDKIGDALLKNADADGALLKKVLMSEKGKTKEQKVVAKNDFMKKYATRMKAAQDKLQPLRKCSGNAKLKQWKKKIDDATDPRKI